MKKNLLRWLVFIVLLSVVIYACHKDNLKTGSPAALTDPGVPLDIQAAKVYYNQLKAQQSDTVASVVNASIKTQSVGGPNKLVNKKYVMFNKAFAGETDTYTFVESPLLYNRRTAF